MKWNYEGLTVFDQEKRSVEFDNFAYICAVYQAKAGGASWTYYRSLWTFNHWRKFGGHHCQVIFLKQRELSLVCNLDHMKAHSAWFLCFEVWSAKGFGWPSLSYCCTLILALLSFHFWFCLLYIGNELKPMIWLCL